MRCSRMRHCLCHIYTVNVTDQGQQAVLSFASFDTSFADDVEGQLHLRFFAFEVSP